MTDAAYPPDEPCHKRSRCETCDRVTLHLWRLPAGAAVANYICAECAASDKTNWNLSQIATMALDVHGKG